MCLYPEICLTSNVMQVPLFVGNAFLILRQLLCIAANVTTNECLTRGKYSYMMGEDGYFRNSFDRGCLANCWQFWCLSRPDWAEVYQQEQRVCHDLLKCWEVYLWLWSCILGSILTSPRRHRRQEPAAKGRLGYDVKHLPQANHLLIRYWHLLLWAQSVEYTTRRLVSHDGLPQFWIEACCSENATIMLKGFFTWRLAGCGLVIVYLFLQAETSLVPPQAASHIIAALEKWKEARVLRRKERRKARASRDMEMQQNLPSRLISDVSAVQP